MDYIFSNHAEEQFALRGISLDMVKQIMVDPDRVIDEEPCKQIYQSVILEYHKKHLYRIFVNICKTPAVIITGYKTSKIEKYEN